MGLRLAAISVALVALTLGVPLVAQQPAGSHPQVVAPPVAPTARLSPVAVREITQITKNLYRAHNNNWTTVFLVTSDGIILGDPISEPFTIWLKAQLAQRFPGRPVRYVVYSHSHWDHAEGGKTFADTAHFVAQENMLREMDGRVPQMPGDMLDRNRDGVFEPEEFRGLSRCGTLDFPHFDRNGDGIVTLAEYLADIRPPDIVYSDRMKLTLGGQTVELVYPGQNHSVDATVMYFPGERVAFATEFIVDAAMTGGFRSWPAACGETPGFDGTPLADWIKSFKVVEALDFDVLVPGHQELKLSKADVVENRVFFEDLVSAVSTGMSQGKSLDELKRTLMFEKYKGWTGYDTRRTLDIEAAFNNLRIYR